MNSNKKSLRMQPLFTDDDGTTYFLFGQHSLSQCLYRQSNTPSVNGDDDEDDGYQFKNEGEREENEGVHFGAFQSVGVGLEGIREFAAKIDGVAQPALYQCFLSRLSEMELLEKKKLREDRRNKMRQQRFQKEFAFTAVAATYENTMGNRRSTRMKGKRKSYKEHVDSDGDGEMEQVDDGESEVYAPSEKSREIAVEQSEAVEEVDEGPQYYPSGRAKRSVAGKRRVSYK